MITMTLSVCLVELI